jgi:hypothetical protein
MHYTLMGKMRLPFIDSESVKFQNLIEKSQKEVKIETSSTQMHERLLSWIGVQALQ